MYQDDVHTAAAKFLAQLGKGNPHYAEEKIEVSALAITDLVLLKQKATPPYFYGFKPSGRPIFTHDMKIARAFNSSCPTIGEHIQKLGTIGIRVEPHLTVWREGRDV
jgi:hypothetical protein